MQSASVFLDATLANVEVGSYINLWKILPVLVVLLLWARLLTWADKDTDTAHLPREGLNLGMMFGLILAFALFLFLPSYAVALPAFIFILLIEVGIYLGLRHSKVGLKDLKQDFKDWIAGLRGQKKVNVVAGAVTFFDKKNNALPDQGLSAAGGYHYDAPATTKSQFRRIISSRLRSVRRHCSRSTGRTWFQQPNRPTYDTV